MGPFETFGAFGLFFALVFVLVIGVFVFVFTKIIGTWNKNNHSPRLTVPATIIGKRVDNSSSFAGHHGHMHFHTQYYVAFEVENGDRVELAVMGHEFGLLVEGDTGNLTFQGTRYLGFDREN